MDLPCIVFCSMSCGIYVLNDTVHPITIGVSFGVTHGYENYVQPGEIFFRVVPPLPCTVYAYCTEKHGEMTNLVVLGEFTLCTVAGGAAIAAAVALGPSLCKY